MLAQLCLYTTGENLKTQNSTTMGDHFLPYIRSSQSCTTFAEICLAFVVSSSCYDIPLTVF